MPVQLNTPLIGITADFMGNGKRPVLTGLSCIAVASSADAVRKRIEKPIQSKWEIVAWVRKSKFYKRFRASRPDSPEL
jgi:hypothetical protein